jgi:hypothetical protein
MVSRRSFLGWGGFVGLGLLAHHKPGHTTGPTTTTSTTTTLPPGGGYSDTYANLY